MALNLKNLGEELKKKLQQTKVGQYFTPESNGGNNFWSSPVSQVGVKAQRFFESPNITNPFPTIQSNSTDKLPTQIGKAIANIPSSFGNSVIGKGFFAPLADISENIGRTLGGRDLIPYNQARSGATRLGYQIGGAYQPTNNTDRFKQTLGNLGDALMPIVDAYVPKGVKGVSSVRGFKNAVGEGIKTGTKFGAGAGLLSGLSENRNTTNNGEYLARLFGTTVGGGVMGAGLGGLTGAGSHLITKNTTYTPEVEGILRNKLGQFKAGDKPVKPTKMSPSQWEFQLKFNKKVGRNPYTPVYPSDLQKAVDLGLSVKKLTKFEHDANVTKAGLYDVAENTRRLNMGEKLDPEAYVEVYHGTSAPNLKSIEKGGFKLGQPSLNAGKGDRIYVSTTDNVGTYSRGGGVIKARVKVKDLLPDTEDVNGFGQYIVKDPKKIEITQVGEYGSNDYPTYRNVAQKKENLFPGSLSNGIPLSYDSRILTKTNKNVNVAQQPLSTPKIDRTQLQGKMLSMTNKKIAELQGKQYKPPTADDVFEIMRKGGAAKEKFKPKVVTKSEGNRQMTEAILGDENNSFKDIFAKWIGNREAAKTTGAQSGFEFRNIPKEKSREVIDFIEGAGMSSDPSVISAAKAWKQRTDQLYTELSALAKEAGLKDLGFLDEYITHYWKETPEQVQEAMLRANKGNPSFKKRFIPTYKQGIDAGLTPKFEHPAEIMSEYVRKMEVTKSNLELFKDLKNNGLVVDAAVAKNMSGFSPINARGFPNSRSNVDGVTFEGNYYAPNDIAQKINRMFSPEAETGTSKVFKTLGNASGKIQDVVLSGGVPATPINAFTAAQVQKELLSGNIRRPIKALIVSLSPERAMQYFKNNAEQIKKMQRRNIQVSSTLDTDSLMGGGPVWDRIVSDPTFKRFMPALQVELFNKVERQALKKFGASEAADIAAKAVSNFYGSTNTATSASRSQIGKDISKAVFFAPKFRESMINFWVNNVKSLKNPLALENRENAKFLVGAAVTYGVMDQLNKKFNGHGLNDNPTGKKDKLLIPVGDTTIGVPFLSSIATVPRGIFRVGERIAKVDPAGAGAETLRTFGSIPVKSVGEMVMNEDYFGKQIYDPESSPIEKGKAIASYLFKNNTHPWLKAALEAKNQPLYQTLSMASEMPLRFYKTSSIESAPFWEKYNETKKLSDKLDTLKYQNPEQAVEFYKQNKDKIDSLDSMKERVGAYYDNNKNTEFLKEGGVFTQDNHVAFVGNDGKFHLIDAKTDISVPELTGNTILDKKLVSSYKSKISSAQSNITKLFENGIIDASQAEAMLQKLETAKGKVGGAKKGKKITFKASTYKPLKINLKRKASLKIPTIKFKKPKKTKIVRRYTIKA